MYLPKLDEDLSCGIRAAFKVFGGKWKLCIIDLIHSGVLRPCDIHKGIPGSTLRVIEIQLAELLAYGMVERFTDDHFPRKSEYRLTAQGESVVPLLKQINAWGESNADWIIARHEETVSKKRRMVAY